MKDEKRTLLERSQSLQYKKLPETAGEPLATNKISKSVTYSFYPPVQVIEDEGPTAQGGSIFLMIFINFLSNVVFSIVLPSLPTFLVEVGAPSYLNGWAVAINSLGTFIASPIFGWWADRRNYREVMAISLVVMTISNIWYALCKDMYQIFAARFLVGVAAANYAPANSYLSYATSTSERTKVMAWNSAASVLGFICGPSFALVTSLPALQFTIPIGGYTLVFDGATAPGWISGFLGLVGLICIKWFKEIPKKTTDNPKVERLVSASMRSFRSLTMVNKTRVPIKAVMVCLFLSFSYTAAFTIFETTGPLYTAADIYTKWGLFENSVLFLGISIQSLVALISLQGLLMVVSDERKLMVIFGLSLTAGLAIFVDWSGGWIQIPRILAGISLISLGYAVGQALLLALFSKILEEQEQGMMMGWLSSAAAISRMTVPIAASYAFKDANPNWIFLATACLVFLAVLMIVVFWQFLDTTKANRATAPTVSGHI